MPAADLVTTPINATGIPETYLISYGGRKDSLTSVYSWRRRAGNFGRHNRLSLTVRMISSIDDPFKLIRSFIEFVIADSSDIKTDVFHQFYCRFILKKG